MKIKRVDTPKEGGFVKFCRAALSWICLLLFVGLAVMNLLHTASMDITNQDYGPEYVLYASDSPLLFIPAALLAVGLFALVGRWLKNVPSQKLAGIISLGIFAVCALWTLMLDMRPRADGDIVLRIAGEWLAGNFESFGPGGYLYKFPYQMGYVALLTLFVRVFGPGKYIPVQLANAGVIALIFWLLYQIAALLMPKETENGRAVLLLSTGCWCLMMYTTFVYGNIPALALALLALWLHLYWELKCTRWYILAASGACLGLSIMLKSFSMIFLVAQAILLILHLLRHRTRQVLVWLAMVLLLWQGSTFCLEHWIESKCDYEVNQGAPMLGSIAMGLQQNEEGIRAPGWYNGYNDRVYIDSGFDRELAHEWARVDVRDRIKQLAGDPAMAKEFFGKKTLSQWAEPTYQGFWISCTANYPPWMESLFWGEAHVRAESLMNWYQSVVWVFGALFLLVRRRHLTMEQMLPGLVIFGGFLFQLFWEGKGQYTLSYFVLALPYAAAGLHMTAEWFRGCWDHLFAGRRREEPQEWQESEVMIP